MRSDWLFSFNDWASISCNDLVLLTGSPRHIQAVFKLIVGILMYVHVMVNWQLLKMASADQCNSTVSLAKVYNSLNGRVFQVIRGPVVVLIDRRLGFKRKRPMISNFLTSSVRSLQGNLRPRPWYNTSRPRSEISL